MLKVHESYLVYDEDYRNKNVTHDIHYCPIAPQANCADTQLPDHTNVFSCPSLADAEIEPQNQGKDLLHVKAAIFIPVTTWEEG